MKLKKYLQAFLLGIAGLSLTMSPSCRNYDNEMFPEIDKLQTDSFHLEGSVAAPIINTKLQLGKFIPSSDSSLWAEVDNEGLIHLRMYYEDLISFQMNEIYPGLNYAGSNQGTTVPANTGTMRTEPEKMDVYSNMLAGHLFFNNPKITFVINNQIPIVTKFRMDTVYFYDMYDERITHAEDQFRTIGAPDAQGGEVEHHTTIDTSNVPTLDEAFSPVPRKVGFFITAGTTQESTLPYDVTGSETLSADVDIDLPLESRLEDLVMGDTIPFSWEDTNYEQAKVLTLKIEFDNGFPFEGIGQIYFADTTNTGEVTPANLIDSAFTDTSSPYIIQNGWKFDSAPTNGVGIVTESKKSLINITLTQERVQNLQTKGATHIILRGVFNHDPANQNPNIYVRMMDDYELGIKISVKLDYEGNTNDDI